MKRTALLTLALLGAALLAGPAARADKDERYEHRREHKGAKHRHEFEDEDCRYRYRADKHGYRESVKCKSRKRHAHGPPPWAPAHGYRRGDGPDSHDEYAAVGERIGIPEGSCNREALGALLGGVVGGVLGSRVGGGDGKSVATIAGTLIGFLVGSQVGRSMDEADRQCTGQVLERAPDRRTVAWTNPDSGARYSVTPLDTFEREGRYCRDYLTEAVVAGEASVVRGTACRGPDGRWRVQPG